MPAPRKHSDEMCQRAKRLVREAPGREPSLSINAACTRNDLSLGILPDTLRGRGKQADIDDGVTPGTTTAESEELTRLRRENAALRRANEIVPVSGSSRSAACSPGTAVSVAPSGYYAFKSRGVSRRALRDAALGGVIEAMFWDREKGRGVDGPAGCGLTYAVTASPPTAGQARRCWPVARWSG